MTLESQRSYENPYTDVEVWVDLKGPGFAKRCYGFWDGGNTFRVRVLATTPGRWVWKSGASAADPGLQGLQGEFTAVPWTETELAENPCRRGMVKASANGHAFEYADGTPFFLLGDTWSWDGVRWAPLAPGLRSTGRLGSCDGPGPGPFRHQGRAGALGAERAGLA